MCMSNIKLVQAQQDAGLAVTPHGFDAHLHVREYVALPAVTAARDAVCQAKMAWSSLEQLLAWRAAAAGATDGEGFFHESEDDEPCEEPSLWEMISTRSAKLCGAPETDNIAEHGPTWSSESVQLVSADPGMLSEVEPDCARSMSSNSSMPSRRLSSSSPSYERLVDLIPQVSGQVDFHSIENARQSRHDTEGLCVMDGTRSRRPPKLRLPRPCHRSLCRGKCCCCLPLTKEELERAGRPLRWFWRAVEWFPCGAGCLLLAASPRSSRSSSADMSRQTSVRELSSTPRVAAAGAA